ncbi:MORN repeat variant [Kordia sp. SMS9]|nr:MORN repeat variant [Kordia sp. SMS9]
MLFVVSCKEKFTYDENGILLFENLTPKTEEYWGAAHSSLWIPVKKTKGPYMYLGEKRYSGRIIKYFQNGNVAFEGSYDFGTENGEWKYYFENGVVKSILTRDSIYGKLYNKKEFFQNGNLKSHHIGNDEEDSTYYISYFKNGNIKYEHYFFTSENEIERFEKRNMNGEVYELFYEDSIYFKKDSMQLAILEQGHYKDRRKKGTWRTYSESNKLLLTTNYFDGQLHGSYQEYYTSGRIKIQGNYSNGDKIGLWKEFYENGNQKILANFKKGRLEGMYKEYHENGTIWERGTYYADERYGTWTFYNENGKIIRKESY